MQYGACYMWRILKCATRYLFNGGGIECQIILDFHKFRNTRKFFCYEYDMPKCILWHGILLSLQSRFHKMNKEKQCSISKKWKNWSLLNKQTRMNEKISFLFWHEKRKWTLAREWAREQKSESVKNQAKLFVIEYLCGIFCDHFSAI